MERAARLIKDKKISREILSDEDIARAVWPAAVGKAIAAHTSRVKLVRKTLVVEVEDAIWQRQLHALTGQILRRLRKLTGSDNDSRPGVSHRRAAAPGATRRVARIGLPKADQSGDEADAHSRSCAKEDISTFAQEGYGLNLTDKEVRYVADLANLRLVR